MLCTAVEPWPRQTYAQAPAPHAPAAFIQF
jgi:hypothetical protein